MKTGGVVIGRAVGHARIAVAQHFYVMETNYFCRGIQLGWAKTCEQRFFLCGVEAVKWLARFFQCRVVDIALFAARATHQHGAHALLRVHGHGWRTL